MIVRGVGLASLVGATVLSASPSQAQQTNTNCTRQLDGSFTCDTYTRQATAPVQAQPFDPDRCALTKPFDILVSGCKKFEVEAANARVALRKQVGSLVAAGRCEDAIKAALQAGDFALADKAKGYCPATH